MTISMLREAIKAYSDDMEVVVQRSPDGHCGAIMYVNSDSIRESEGTPEELARDPRIRDAVIIMPAYGSQRRSL